MYSFLNLEPVSHSMSWSNCCFLTCIQVSQEADKVFWYFLLFKNFPQFVMIHTVKGFIVVDEAEVDVFLEFSCFFYDPVDAGNLISRSSPFSTSSLYIWKFMVHILLKPILKDFVFDPKLVVEVYMWTFINLSEVRNIKSPSVKKWAGKLLWLEKVSL